MEQNINGQIISVDRALTLLMILGTEEDLSVTDAARRLAIAPSTAHRLLSTLTGRGFAMQGRRRRYTAGPALLAPGRARPTPSLVERVRPYLEQLFDATAETSHLMVRIRADVHFVDGIEGTHALRVGLRTGMRMPARATSGGKAMLAELDPAALEALGAGPTASLALTDTRRPAPDNRLGVNRDESESGVTALGASIGIIDGDHAALTIAVPSARLTTERAQDHSRVLLEICASARHELERADRPGIPSAGKPAPPLDS